MIKKYLSNFKIAASNYVIERGHPTRIQILLWGGIVALTLSLSLINYDSFQIGAYNDDANYVILARTILNSNEYGINLSGTDQSITQFQFPFGYPLLLSPLTDNFS